MREKLIMSGMRPTGRLHIGHIAGVIDNWLKFQEVNKCYFEIADLHALTDKTDHLKLGENIINMVTDWIVLGINPQKSTIFLQSLIPEHSELYLLFSMITPINWATHCPVFKDKKLEDDNLSLGLLNYPVLQAADIALYKGTHIPIGEDQKPHIELSRKIIKRFNRQYKNLFPLPEAIFTDTPKIIGFDGRKMSKSLENYLSPSHTKEEIILRTKKMITDPKKIKKEDCGDPDICSVYSIHRNYNDKKETVKEECISGLRGCVDCKNELANILYIKFQEFREKRSFYESRSEEIKDIIYEGTKKAREVARSTMEEIREAMKINF